MTKLKIKNGYATGTQKVAAYGSSTVELLKYLNNIDLARPKLDVIDFFNGNYLKN